jgi:hypothetical protein
MDREVFNSRVKGPLQTVFPEIITGNDAEGLMVDVAFGNPQTSQF